MIVSKGLSCTRRLNAPPAARTDFNAGHCSFVTAHVQSVGLPTAEGRLDDGALSCRVNQFALNTRAARTANS